MFHRTKRTLAVVFALSALGALAASPATAEFKSSVEHTIHDGSQVGSDLFAFNAGGVSCSEISYSGTGSSKTSSTITLAPTYKGCTAFGFPGVTIDVNGCQLVVGSAVTNTAAISCPGAPMEITGPSCTLTIASQSGLGSVSYVNEGAAPKRDIKVNFELSGIKYTQHGKGATPCTSATFSNGTYKGIATLTGTDTAGAQIDLWVEPPLFHSSVKPTTFDGTQAATHIFMFNSGVFSCKNITFSGTQSEATATKLQLQPSYSGCSWFFGAVTIDTNGCQFVFNVAQVDIVCPGKPMEITAGACNVTIGSQSLTAVNYTNQGTAPKRDVLIQFALTGLKYTEDSPLFPECSGTFSNGTYQGSITVTGTDEAGGQADFWFS